MEHESFEDAGIAKLLNENFVCIKVDREERPDVDKVYMNAVQIMTGRGGWPMSVFLTPDLRPFYAGTYWPHPPRGGMPGFAQVLDALIHAWNTRQNEVREHADEITTSLINLAAGPDANPALQVADPSAIDIATQRLIRIADTKLGGFGSAPKFPHVTDLDLLLRQYTSDGDPKKLRVVTTSLDAMAHGGIFDHIGGGFARYSVDVQWLVPHFEKMLYDNALLAKLYTEAFQATGNSHYQKVARETLDYLLRDMRDPDGGIHSSEDADSEGVEGEFYVWTPVQVHAILGEERGGRFCEIYDVTAQGNFEGRNIPHLKQSLAMVAMVAEVQKLDREALVLDLEECREQLRLARERRVRPGRDDKVLMGWNSMACEALATAGAIFDETRFVMAAEEVATFIWTTMRRTDGGFYHAFRRGHAHLKAYQDDLADYIAACLAVFRATGKARWVERASKVAHQMIEHFEDHESGGFFFTEDSAELVIARQKDWHDSSVRSGNGTAVNVLLELAVLTGEDRFALSARRTLIAAGEVIAKQSAAAAQMLISLDRYHQGNEQVVIAAFDWEQAAALRAAYFQRYRPHTTLSWVIGNAPTTGPVAALNANKGPIEGRPTLYLCKDYRCDSPLMDDAAVSSLR